MEALLRRRSACGRDLKVKIKESSSIRPKMVEEDQVIEPVGRAGPGRCSPTVPIEQAPRHGSESPCVACWDTDEEAHPKVNGGLRRHTIRVMNAAHGRVEGKRCARPFTESDAVATLGA